MWDRSAYNSGRESFGTSWPSTQTVPRSGSSNPTMCLIATDLPLPEKPMRAIVWPSSTSREKPSRTFLGPNDLYTSISLIMSQRCTGSPAGEGGLGHLGLVESKATERGRRLEKHRCQLSVHDARTYLGGVG